MTEDISLLRHYANTGSEAAFAEIVQRQVNLVYSVALRQVGGDTHLAQDVTQTVFTSLARKARALKARDAISGWLYRSTQFAASDAVRAHRRRRARETEAYAMHDTTFAPEPPAEFEKLRPLLDEAIGELSEMDRDAVCLRFFENRNYADIGRCLHVSENTARMRVERALHKLHGLLAARGVTSTTAVLALTLPGQAAVTAPAGFAATLASTAVATAAASGAVAVGAWGVIQFMATTKTTLVVATIASVAALGTTLYLRHEALAERDVARAAHAAANARMTEFEAEVIRLRGAREAAEAEVTRLRSALDAAAVQRKAQPEGERITKQSVDARYARAKELDQKGQFQEALAEYLWCYDTGMVQVASFGGVRLSFLVGNIAQLGDRFPAALAALRERKEAAQQRFMGSAADVQAGPEIAAINRVLKEEGQTMRLYDSLAADDPRRATLGFMLFDQLAAAQRYQDAVKVKPYNQLSAQFEMFASRTPQGAPEHAERLQQAQRSMVIRGAVTGVEVLAGSGDIERAAELALRLLDFDSSPETVALLERHAARAGKPDMIPLLLRSR